MEEKQLLNGVKMKKINLMLNNKIRAIKKLKLNEI